MVHQNMVEGGEGRGKGTGNVHSGEMIRRKWFAIDKKMKREVKRHGYIQRYKDRYKKLRK